jgi:hypothetical protein
MYNPRTVTVELVMPDGYYDEWDDLSDEGRLTLQQILQEADITVTTIEQ